ncbi:unnamed protein product [Rangifer tarandus platyrhynchus]|uniref:Uncharacterized protein n=2 Tax=Rangifer tarandus platyrhynchus TaxID=3082113 RepID=A0ABN8XU58_RANTA|nr:unnamed protein product [Rangifer tarandus platyrhynchus]CAI9691521.1 unnamed protein product [Rangifer tarandus platyrhynchus]
MNSGPLGQARRGEGEPDSEAETLHNSHFRRLHCSTLDPQPKTRSRRLGQKAAQVPGSLRGPVAAARGAPRPAPVRACGVGAFRLVRPESGRGGREGAVVSRQRGQHDTVACPTTPRWEGHGVLRSSLLLLPQLGSRSGG